MGCREVHFTFIGVPVGSCHADSTTPARRALPREVRRRSKRLSHLDRLNKQQRLRRLRNEHGRIELAHRVAWRLSGRPLTQAENWITNVAKPHFASIRSILKKSRIVGTFFVVTAQRRHDTEISDAAVVTQ